ncbi:MAG: hypothetical protein CM15mV51_1090 [uncultured marine virus]|nr:MAG: hypothetical protein CM15mV51_1090 [uncultured marine virus]
MRKNPNVKKIKPGRFKNNYQVLDVDFTVSDPNVSKINQKEPKQTYIMGEVQKDIR